MSLMTVMSALSLGKQASDASKKSRVLAIVMVGKQICYSSDVPFVITIFIV